MSRGAYDIGRKPFYYLVVVFIIAILFIYMSNAIGTYQEKSFQDLDELEHLILVHRVLACFAAKDPEFSRSLPGTLDLQSFSLEALKGCVGTVPVRVTLGDNLLRTTLQGNFDRSYPRYVLLHSGSRTPELAQVLIELQSHRTVEEQLIRP